MKNMTFRSPFLTFLLLFLTPAILLSIKGCETEQTFKESPESEIGVPPSISQKKTSNVITIPEKQARNLDIQIYTVKKDGAGFKINAPGQVFAAPGHISMVSSPINGRVSKIYVHEGERVEKGDPLLDLESLELADMAGNYLETTAEIIYQKQQVERLTVLADEQISARRTLERAQADLNRAQTRKSAALARLRAVGITPKDAAKWERSTSEPTAELTIQAPLSGVLNQHLIELGESVNAYDKLLDIIDKSHVMVKGFVSPGEAPFVRKGTPVIVSENSSQDQTVKKQISGSVTSVNPALDQDNRSLVLNTIIETQNDWPLVGQRVHMEYTAQPMDSYLAIPLSAVQFEQQSPAVFIQQAPRRYVKRFVQIERITEDSAIIAEGKGLQPGDKIATTQVFTLKALERFNQYAD